MQAWQWEIQKDFFQGEEGTKCLPQVCLDYIKALGLSLPLDSTPSQNGKTLHRNKGVSGNCHMCQDWKQLFKSMTASQSSGENFLFFFTYFITFRTSGT